MFWNYTLRIYTTSVCQVQVSKPTMTCSQAFPRFMSHIFLSFDCITGLSLSFLISQDDCFGFNLENSIATVKGVSEIHSFASRSCTMNQSLFVLQNVLPVNH